MVGVLIAIGVLVCALLATGWFFGPARGSRSRSVRPRAAVGSPRAGGPPGLDLEEATRWVVGRLPGEITSELDSRDVRRIIDWNLEYFRSRTASSNGHSAHSGGHVVVAGAETVDYVLARADALGVTYTPVQVHAVLDAQMSYLQEIGAVLPEEPGQ